MYLHSPIVRPKDIVRLSGDPLIQDSLTLPAPAFFDFQEKKRYVITREEANEYERRTEAARLQAVALQAVAAASQYDPNFNFGYPPGQPWP